MSISRTTTSADLLLRMLESAIGSSPLRVRAWDGSEAGPADGPVLVVRSRRALRRMLWRPDDLGMGRAYVAGEVDVDGDLLDALAAAADVGLTLHHRAELSLRDRAALLGRAARVGAVGPAPAPPPEEVVVAGRRHSRSRDRAAVSSHYDVGNEFYRHILGPSMVYSCAYWRDEPEHDRNYTLEDAQRDKLDLVCRKLGLRPGMRVLDVGCGWGSFAQHAAAEYGVDVLGITLSEQQVRAGRERIAAVGLADHVQLRLQDWRTLDEGGFDAIASIGMAEHVGREHYDHYCAAMLALLRPGGRLLNHQIAATPGPQPGHRTFIDAYVFPDGDLLPLAMVIDKLELAGFEVRDVQCLREHYGRTLRAWVRNLERHWDECVRLTSPGRARVWHLYMALSAIGFERGLLRVNQTLTVRPTADGVVDIPPVRERWLTPR
ncbi:SAM-dependent methyltransferase [Speluncibacter jeojiensis]|uniref:SAM-dependent methyltransferase n=1 Tax=Speluncibacter jeojiensis TaxID=2710754 RepID=UPI00240FF5B6|nr:cyclopropane-fatty-acyl-phospholipid synthase family protein [Rhodococcus sp. D2-41]